MVSTQGNNAMHFLITNTMDMVIDKMHFHNHVDNWCKTNCNPYDRKDLDGVSYLVI